MNTYFSAMNQKARFLILPVASLLCLGLSAWAESSNFPSNPSLANKVNASENKANASENRAKTSENKAAKKINKTIIETPASVFKLLDCASTIAAKKGIPVNGVVKNGVFWAITGENSSQTIYDKNGNGNVYTCPDRDGQSVLTIDQNTGKASCLTFTCDAKGNVFPVGGPENPTPTPAFDCAKAVSDRVSKESGFIASGKTSTQSIGDDVWEFSCPGGGALAVNSSAPTQSKCNSYQCSKGALTPIATNAKATKTFDCAASKTKLASTSSWLSTPSHLVTLANGDQWTVTCPTGASTALNATTPPSSTCKTLACSKGAVVVASSSAAASVKTFDCANPPATDYGVTTQAVNAGSGKTTTFSCPAGTGNLTLKPTNKRDVYSSSYAQPGSGADIADGFIYRSNTSSGYCTQDGTKDKEANGAIPWPQKACYIVARGTKYYCNLYTDGGCQKWKKERGKSVCANWRGGKYGLKQKEGYFHCFKLLESVQDYSATCQNIATGAGRCTNGKLNFTSTTVPVTGVTK